MASLAKWLAPFALVALVSGYARADLAPPPGYVERCSVEKQRQLGEECVSCSTYFGEPDACQKQHGSRGFAFRCRTRGASTWSEVWCKRASAEAVSSFDEPRDAGASPEPEKSAEPAATDAAAPSASSTAERPGVPAPEGSPRVSAGTTEASKPSPLPEKGGSCGACELGRQRPATPLSAIWLALALCCARRLTTGRGSRC